MKTTKIYCRILNGESYYGFEENMKKMEIQLSGVYTPAGIEKSGFFGECREMTLEEVSKLLIKIQEYVNNGYKLLPCENL